MGPAEKSALQGMGRSMGVAVSHPVMMLGGKIGTDCWQVEHARTLTLIAIIAEPAGYGVRQARRAVVASATIFL